jgi:hypothetical protein
LWMLGLQKWRITCMSPRLEGIQPCSLPSPTWKAMPPHGVGQETKGREEPWLHLGVIQGMRWDRICPEEFWLHLEVQTLWPCECHKWKLEAICEGLFRNHAWDSAHAWVRLCVPIRDGALNLGQTKAWGKLALFIIQSHHWRVPKFLVRPKKGPTMLKSGNSWNLVPLPASSTKGGEKGVLKAPG